jgi:signal transduction histidine kinase
MGTTRRLDGPGASGAGDGSVRALTRARVADVQASPVAAMLAMSRAVAAGGSLSAVLDAVAAEAARVMDGIKATSVVLITGGRSRFRLAGSHGLSAGYHRHLSGPTALKRGQGPSGYAVQSRTPVLITDIEVDARFARWRQIARGEGWRSLLSLPLDVRDDVVGTLNVYRSAAGAWADADVELLTFFADHAASAVETAQLIDQQNKQVTALRRLVRALEEQTHEHANRLHALHGLLALGETEEAQRFLEGLASAHRGSRSALEDRALHPTLAGLLLAETAIAAQRGIALEVAVEETAVELPKALSDTQLVTIVGNLLDNAFDAVAEMTPERRRVRIAIAVEDDAIAVEVRDWGAGMPASRASVFARGVTTKDEHPGVGLALVHEAATAVMGRVEVRSHADGTSFVVLLPHA